MNPPRVFLPRLLPLCLLLCLVLLPRSFAEPPPKAPLLLAHYLPWYAAKPTSQSWGWHWTMNHFQPEKDGLLASHYHPLMGLYDSSDPDALECQVLLMKLSGIDGVLIDWYGTDDYLDYGQIHRNTLALIAAVKKAHLRYALVYEDQSVPKLVAGHVFPEADAVPHARQMMGWVQSHWFADPAYLTLGGRPVFLVFGSGYYTGPQLTQIFAGLPRPPLFLTEQDRRPPAGGAFAWPQPQEGEVGSARASDSFYAQSALWPAFMPAAWPRFHDIYSEAGVQPSFPRLADRDGKTYADTLARATRSGAAAVQIVTWNDWGEGTQIEPSVEFGYRDLEATQKERRRLTPSFPYTAADLRLPLRLYQGRKNAGTNAAKRIQMEMLSRLLFAGKTAEARALLAAPAMR